MIWLLIIGFLLVLFGLSDYIVITQEDSKNDNIK